MIVRQPKLGEFLAYEKTPDAKKYFYIEPLPLGQARICLTDGDSIYSQWMYARMCEAVVAICEWDGEGDPPGPWLRALREGDNDFVRREANA